VPEVAFRFFRIYILAQLQPTIDEMLAAGATSETLAIIARQHSPELAPTVDALIAAGTERAVIAAMLKGSAADVGAAAREEEKRKRDTESKRNRRRARKVAEAIQGGQSDLPLSDVSSDSADTADPRPPLGIPLPELPNLTVWTLARRRPKSSF
jgi:hypothetical protein